MPTATPKEGTFPCPCSRCHTALGQHHAGVGPRSLRPPRVLREPQPRAAGSHQAADAAGDHAALQEVASHNSLFLAGLVCDQVPTTFASPAAGPCSIPGAWGLRSLTSTTAPSPTAAPVLPFQAWRELEQPRAHLLSLPTAPEGARLPAPSRGGHRPRDKAQAEAPTPFPNARVHGRDCPKALPRCLAQPMAAPSQPTGTSTGGSWGCPW